MITNFQKGQKVVEFRSWDDKGIWSYRVVTIQSWGKIRGTATLEENGAFRKEQYYTSEINSSPCNIYMYTFDGLDIESKGLELAQAYIDHKLNSLTKNRPDLINDIEHLKNASPKIIKNPLT